jgi:hypothetical protein
MPITDIYRDAVLEKLANGRLVTKIGRVTYQIDGKLYHIKMRTGEHKKYPFNINETVLDADFEVCTRSRASVLSGELV